MNRIYNCKVLNLCASHSDTTRRDIYSNVLYRGRHVIFPVTGP